MRFLIIEEAGNHPETSDYRVSMCLHRALIRKGHGAELWGKGYAEPNTLQLFIDDCDVIILLENYDTGWVPDLSKCGKQIVFWSIDSHCAFDAHIKQAKRQRASLVLCSVFDCVEKFRKKGFACVYFPNAYPSDLFDAVSKPDKTYDIGYCGNIGNAQRQEYLRYFVKRKGMDLAINVLGDSMVRAIASYKIHFNRNLSTDVNYRTFETLGAGTLLLTNDTPGLSALFDVGDHLITYTTQQDAYNKMNFYLNNATERRAVTKSGYEYARSHHTFDNRATKLLGLLEGNQ